MKIEVHLPEWIKSVGDTLREASAELTAREDIIDQQRKEIANLLDMVKDLSGEKVKQRELAKVAAAKTFITAKNASYGQSVWIGFRESILYAPAALVDDLKFGIGAVVAAIFLILGGVLKFIFQRFTLLALGAFGRLSPQKART